MARFLCGRRFKYNSYVASYSTSFLYYNQKSGSELQPRKVKLMCMDLKNNFRESLNITTKPVLILFLQKPALRQ